MREELRIENTDAESVDDIMAASNMDSAHPKVYSGANHPNRKCMNVPVMAVVSSTPTVASDNPCRQIGFI